MERERWGTLERVPRTPQNFSRIIWLSGIGTVARFRAFLIFLSRRLQGGWRAAPVPGGGVPFWLPAYSAFSLLSRPHPPYPPSRREGGDFEFSYARGFAPCIPGAEPEGAPEQGSKPRAQRGLVPGGAGRLGRWRCARGGLPFWSPADPAFSVLSFPHPPDPLPGGKGVPKSLFRRGLRPRHPGTEPPTALTDPSIQVPCGKLAFLRHGFPPPRQSPKTRFPTGNASAAPVQPPGMQGAKPLA